MKLEMTNQEIFNIVYNGLKSQNFRRSMNNTHDTCAYRGSNGKKCAAGWLIPDKLYKKEFEGRHIISVVELIDFFGNRREFIYEMQNIHDYNDDPEDMKNELEKLADKYDLKIPE